jgi:hypothetical protein
MIKYWFRGLELWRTVEKFRPSRAVAIVKNCLGVTEASLRTKELKFWLPESFG